MSEYKLIKDVKSFDIEEARKPKINYADFEIMVEGRKVTIGVPAREAERFQNLLVESMNFNKRMFRALMREFRAVRKGEL
jgi:hypothetical protein